MYVIEYPFLVLPSEQREILQLGREGICRRVDPSAAFTPTVC
jgi:hypothetical protein